MIVSKLWERVRFVVFVVSRVERSRFELIFSYFQLQLSILFADNVELADHFIMIDQSFRIQIQGQYSFAALTSSDRLLEFGLTIDLPFFIQIYPFQNLYFIRSRVPRCCARSTKCLKGISNFRYQCTPNLHLSTC